MFSSATRIIVLIGSLTFAACLVIIIIQNANDKEIVGPVVTAIISFFTITVGSFFSGRKPEQPQDPKTP